MQPILTDHLPQVQELCREYQVQSMFAFGSVCTDSFTPTSDIDFLVSFLPMDFGDYADAYFEFADKLENIFHRKVDLITEKSLSNPFFIKSLEKTKTRIYG